MSAFGGIADIAVSERQYLIFQCRLLLSLVLLLLAAPALAAPRGGDFNTFLAAIARDAQGRGVSRSTKH
jgi:hypothetical protein